MTEREARKRLRARGFHYWQGPVGVQATLDRLDMHAAVTFKITREQKVPLSRRRLVEWVEARFPEVTP